MSKILIAEDEAQLREFYEHFFINAGHQVKSAADGIEAFQLFLSFAPDIVLTDHHMPGMKGLEFIALLRKQQYTTPVILISGDNIEPQDTPDDVMVFKKPLDTKKLNLLLTILAE